MESDFQYPIADNPNFNMDLPTMSFEPMPLDTFGSLDNPYVAPTSSMTTTQSSSPGSTTSWSKIGMITGIVLLLCVVLVSLILAILAYMKSTPPAENLTAAQVAQLQALAPNASAINTLVDNLTVGSNNIVEAKGFATNKSSSLTTNVEFEADGGNVTCTSIESNAIIAESLESQTAVFGDPQHPSVAIDVDPDTSEDIIQITSAGTTKSTLKAVSLTVDNGTNKVIIQPTNVFIQNTSGTFNPVSSVLAFNIAPKDLTTDAGLIDFTPAISTTTQGLTIKMAQFQLGSSFVIYASGRVTSNTSGSPVVTMFVMNANVSGASPTDPTTWAKISSISLDVASVTGIDTTGAAFTYYCRLTCIAKSGAPSVTLRPSGMFSMGDLQTTTNMHPFSNVSPPGGTPIAFNTDTGIRSFTDDVTLKLALSWVNGNSSLMLAKSLVLVQEVGGTAS